MVHGSVSERLRAKASVRKATVVIEDDEFVVREVSAEAFHAYGELTRAGKRVAANALLLRECLLQDDHDEPALTEADAEDIAKSTRLVVPLVSKILELSLLTGSKEDEKKS